MKYGCIGEHLTHSFSKEIHKKLGNNDYIIREIQRTELTEFIKSKEYSGLNVTIPYKEAVIPFLDYIDESAERIGAVNTVVNENGKLKGYNTDFSGMISLIKKMNLDLKDKNVLILGTGGTSKTAFAVADYLGAKKITKVSRKNQENTVTYSEAAENFRDTQIIINTTPCGMFPKNSDIPIDISHFPKLSGVIDAVYNPIRSRLCLEASKRGLKSEGGLYMLVAQAAFASEKFLNTNYDFKQTDKVYREVLREKENIVLIGMPGCGKTTIGKILADKLNFEFIDTDAEIERIYKKSPKEIIENDGIEAFRKAESEIIKDISAKNSCVISTGGGAVLNEENIINLKQNGKIFFIDRNISEIVPTADRPLSSNSDALKKLYDERIEIYLASKDIKIDNNRNIDFAVNSVLDNLKD